MKKSETINQLINFFWTILCFLPILYYWPGKGFTWLVAFVAISFIFGLLPSSWFCHFQLSRKSHFYEALGVKQIRKFVQNGTYANRAASNPNTNHKVIRNQVAARKYLNTINMYERYHMACFVFFILTFINALCYRQYILAVSIFIANIIYNLCPILLQQYNKIRVLRILD